MAVAKYNSSVGCNKTALSPASRCKLVSHGSTSLSNNKHLEKHLICHKTRTDVLLQLLRVKSHGWLMSNICNCYILKAFRTHDDICNSIYCSSNFWISTTYKFTHTFMSKGGILSHSFTWHCGFTINRNNKINHDDRII